MKIKNSLALTIAMILLLNCCEAKLKKDKEIIQTEHTKTFHEKDLNPHNTRTKIHMIKTFIAAVLDQLNVPSASVDSAVEGVSGSQLIACMNLFKDIARGNKSGKDLIALEQHIKVTGLKEKLEDEAKVKNAVEFINAYVSHKTI